MRLGGYFLVEWCDKCNRDFVSQVRVDWDGGVVECNVRRGPFGKRTCQTPAEKKTVLG